MYTGKQLISLVIPKINYEKKNSVFNKKENDKYFDNNDGFVYIYDSELFTGCFEKDIIGSKNESIQHIISFYRNRYEI